jgi:hypothetical protein
MRNIGGGPDGGGNDWGASIQYEISDTSDVIAIARTCRRRGLSTWPVPLEKLEELAEYLRAVDQLVLSAEAHSRISNPYGGWAETERLSLERLVDALDEVRS